MHIELNGAGGITVTNSWRSLEFFVIAEKDY